jgi:hypothetical protein
VEVALQRLAGPTKIFCKESTELHEKGLTWPKFKTFRNRYKDVHTDQYNDIKLQTARQSKGEEPRVFADRCTELEGKSICKVEDPVPQRINENSEGMCYLVL